MKPVNLIAKSKSVTEIELWLCFLLDVCMVSNIGVNAQNWKLNKLNIERSDPIALHCLSDAELEIDDSYTLTRDLGSDQPVKFAYWCFGDLLNLTQTIDQLKPRANSFELWLIEQAKILVPADTSGYSMHQKITSSEAIKLACSGKVTIRLFPVKFMLNIFGCVISTLVAKPKTLAADRALLSLNWRSAEFAKLKGVSGISSLQLFFNAFLHKRETHFYSYSACNLRKELIGVWLDRFTTKPICYIGLPGARLISEIVDGLSNNVTTVHVSHGRVTSNKFLKYTDFVFSAVEDEYNCGRLKRCSEQARFIMQEGNVAWVHGYKKGKFYGLRSLYDDLKTLRKIQHENSGKNIFVFPHPTANLFSISIRLLSIISKKVYNKSIRSAVVFPVEAIYSSSPTFYKYYYDDQQDTSKQSRKISLINLRKE